MARAGLRPIVFEAEGRIGGGARTESLTLPGYRHDVCSSVHPMAAASPCFRELGLEARGVEWVHPDVPLAHPFDDGTAALLERSTRATGQTLDPADARAWGRLFDPFVESWDALIEDALQAPIRVPKHPLLMARMGLLGLRSASALAMSRFEGRRARALFGGISAHTLSPPDHPLTSAFGLMLASAAHAVGWPFARRGSRSIVESLASVVLEHGGRIETGRRIASLAELPAAAATFLDLTPRQVLSVGGERLPPRYRWWLSRYRYGPGVFKVDWALREPIPWRARDCARAGTVHLGGDLDEVRTSANAAWAGEADPRPFVLLSQPSLFDATRAPGGGHVAWAYCHVPHGSTVDMTDGIEAQVERFAPGFRETIVARHTLDPAGLEAHDANLIGGDIGGGLQDIRQFLARPVPRPHPWRTPIRGLYLCSSSTPPGGGVHGMCGWNAARSALERLD